MRSGHRLLLDEMRTRYSDTLVVFLTYLRTHFAVSINPVVTFYRQTLFDIVHHQCTYSVPDVPGRTMWTMAINYIRLYNTADD